MPTRVYCRAWTQSVPITLCQDVISGKAFENLTLDAIATSHRWIVPIPEDTHLLEHCLTLLTKKEKERADRFRHEGAYQQFLVGHATVHSIMRHLLGNDYEEVEWMETEHHKPFIRIADTNQAFEYNLSHCEGFIAVAVGTAPQGIDIEKQRHLEDLEGISRQVFTDSEVAQVFSSQDANQQHATFYKFWTCKEAALKADGTGFMKDPKSLELYFEDATAESSDPVFWSAAMEGYNLAWTERA